MSGIAAGISAGAAVLGAGTSAVGSIKAGQARSQSDQANAASQYYQAQVARNNAKVARQNAVNELLAGEERTVRKSQEGAVKMGQLKAVQGASGVDMGSQSSVDTQVSQRELDQLDTETVMHNSQVRAYGYKAQAENFEAQGDLYQAGGARYSQAAAYDPTAGYLEAGGTLLSRASTLPWKFGGNGETTGTSPAGSAAPPGATSGAPIYNV